MNGISLTQSGSLLVFYELVKAVREPLRLGKMGLYVADRTFYSAFRQQCPDIERGRGLLEMERLFDEVQPDFVISFDRLNQQALSLPSSVGLRGGELETVIAAIKEGTVETGC